jgi:hypothetical protein
LGGIWKVWGVRLCRVSGARGIPPPREATTGSFREVDRAFKVAGAAGTEWRCASPTVGSVAGRLPSPRPPRPLPLPAGSPRDSLPTAAPTEAGADDLHDLGLPFEALPRALVPPRGRSSSREIRAPLRRQEPSASTPGSKLPSARRCDAPHMFRPRGFSPPRRFAPHTAPRACCIPQPARGSSRFRSTGAGPVLPNRSWTDTVADLRSPFPRRWVSHPSKSVLVDSRNRVTAVRCLLAVTGARPTATAAEAATREVGPGEPGAAGPPPAGAGATRWHGPSSRYGEAPIRRERRTPTSPGRAGTGEPMRSTRRPTRRQRRSADERSGRVPGEAACPHGASQVGDTGAPEGAPRAVRRPRPPDHCAARPTRRSVPGGLFETTRAADFRALLRRRVRGVAPPLPADEHPILPWALFPSKVHSRSAPRPVHAGTGQTPRAEARAPAMRTGG